MPDATADRLGRNELCRCGSGKKYKRCCLRKDETTEREEQAKASAEETTPPPEVKPGPDSPKPQRPTEQPWKRGAHNYQPFQRFLTPRKRGGGG